MARDAQVCLFGKQVPHLGFRVFDLDVDGGAERHSDHLVALGLGHQSERHSIRQDRGNLRIAVGCSDGFLGLEGGHRAVIGSSFGERLLQLG